MTYFEANFDGLIGPSHNYSGLSLGNLASARNAKDTANPREAALQGLDKMEALMKLGLRQGFFLPQQRPCIRLLHQLGFRGTPQAMLEQVAKQQPELLSLVYSASPMWAANAATVTPSPDSDDGRVHFTPANLITTPHRAIEACETEKLLRTVFNSEAHFKVHAPLPMHPYFGDEGAANHNRLCREYGATGEHIFVYGKHPLRPQDTALPALPARQSALAGESVARQHGISASRCLHIQQHPAAIDAGAFHNDVVAVCNERVFLFHEHAFTADGLAALKQQLPEHEGYQLVMVPASALSLEEAVQSYLFNSQLVSLPGTETMCLVAPEESRESEAVSNVIDEIIQADNAVGSVVFKNLRQSMKNGGGPACLRLRVVLSEEEWQAIDPRFGLTDTTVARLRAWVNRYYRDRLAPADLLDPEFVDEQFEALDALTSLLSLGSYYDFQQG